MKKIPLNYNILKIINKIIIFMKAIIKIIRKNELSLRQIIIKFNKYHKPIQLNF